MLLQERVTNAIFEPIVQFSVSIVLIVVVSDTRTRVLA